MDQLKLKSAMKLVVFVLAICAIAAIYALTPLRSYLSLDRLQDLRGLIAATGFWAPLVFILCYAAATVFVLPGSALTILAGVVFGPWWGTLVVIIAANLGANICFFISRFLGGGFAERLLKGGLKKTASQLEHHGFWVMFGLRLLPIVPFNLLNYASGLAPLKWRDYALASFLGMIPGTFAYVSLGNTVNHISLTDPKAWLQVEVWGPFLLIVFLVVGSQLLKKHPWVKKRLEIKEKAHERTSL